ncbi:hypothetical protein GUA87_03645 [Sneathiella sp. P13V-1]|uniref:hypothetical protein n=1 Tax=Sneathiella sp. P13V-1 TaxID=2697366 RepID=UPI00187B2BBA|nr:hypothetical protein [Sneathiella sp. P13V-1]MBE7635923.1 hypothetical protein [Sneathiella sp. P13V-1]
MQKIAATIFLLLLLSSCIPENSSDYAEVKVGENYENFLRIGTADMQIPLPKGVWKLVGIHNYKNDVGTTFSVGLLADIQDGLLERSIVFEVPLGTTRTGYEKNERCERGTYQFTRNRFNVEGGIQDCWYVNHNLFRMNAQFEETDLKPDYMKQARRFFIANDVKTPTETVYVKYHKASSTKLMNVWYHFNPETKGFAGSSATSWGKSSWHRDQTKSDPTRSKYIQDLKNWGIRFEEFVTAGFAGKVGEKGQIPDMIELAKDLKGKKPSPEAKMELARLTEMHSEGHITSEEYGELVLYIIWKY